MENMDLDVNCDLTFDLPMPSFDTFSDPDQFFDFDTCAGPAPEGSRPSSQTPPQPTEVAQDAFDSLFDDMDVADSISSNVTMPDIPPTTFSETQRPADVQPPLDLVLPASCAAAALDNKEACFEDIFGDFPADFSAPVESLPGNPTSVAPQDIFSLPSGSWQAEETKPFTWNPATDFSLGFFTEPQMSTPQTKTPNITAQTTPFFPDLSSVSAGEIPFTFDEEALSLLSNYPPIVSLTSPQSVVPPSFPAPTLQHPRPIAPVSPSFTKTETIEQGFGLGPSSIIDAQGHIKFAPVSSTASLSPEAPNRVFTTPVVNGKVIKRIPRPAKAKDVNASDWYSAPPQIPSWGGPSPSHPLFNYNSNGEWSPNQRYSRDEILYYLTERKRLNLPLTLWIQNLPHGCVKRVTDGRTLKCRWDGCPAQNGTILKGFWRVCFDERPETSGKQHNPFHNAGYMHLWCLDRCFDLFEISQAFDLRPDTRHFEKEERNPMAMTRDHDELVMEFESWREEQKKSYEEWRALSETNKLLGLPTENRAVDQEQKLWYLLTAKHLSLETVVRQTMRDSRGGISIDQHKGDLGWYIKKVNERKRHARAQKDAGSRALARLGECEEVFSDDEDVPETRPRQTVRTKESVGEMTKSRKADDDLRKPESKEIDNNNNNKRHRCAADECEYDGGHKRQRRHGRFSI